MIAQIVILFFQLFLLNKIIRFFILSPIYLYVLFSLVSISLTVWYFYFFENKFSFFNLDDVSEKLFLNTIKLYIIALNTFIFGVIMYYEFSKKKVKLRFNKSFAESLFINYQVPSFFIKICYLLFFLLLLLYVITYGKGLLIRTDYLPGTNRILTTLLKVLTFVEIIFLGLIYNKEKLLSTILFLATILLSISTGSRAIFLFFLFYTCLVFISSGNNLFNKLRFILHIIIGFVFLAYIMQLRQLDVHGLIPYLKSIGSSSNDFFRNFFYNIYYSFIYGVFVTIGTIQKSQLDWNIILININPLPGNIAGWYKYAEKMRLNTYVPYSLHGRVFKTGIPFTIFFFFTVGILFSYFENAVRKMLSSNKRIMAYLIVILLSLHIIYAFEYNMRASVRYFYYAFFIIFITYLIRQIKKNLPKLKKE